ncbi:MAG: PAS domain-containing protein [Halieaceae bacterium]|nr:PAS domain-containing protein [Halieaceae bacterium]
MKHALKLLPTICASAAIAIAIMGLLGYVPGLAILGSVKENYIPMAPSTAISFVLLGSVLATVRPQPLPEARAMVFMVIASLVLLFGLLEVAGSFSGLDLNFEDRIVPAAGNLAGVPIGRMSPATGAAFLVCGVATFFVVLQRRSLSRKPATEYVIAGLGALALVISTVFSLAYLYGTPLLYGQGATIPMALTTAVGFLFLSVSILTLDRESFPLRFLVEDSTRGYALRFILPVSIVFVTLSGFTALASERILVINPAFMSAAMTALLALFAGVFALLFSNNLGRKIERSEQAARDAYVALRQSEERFELAAKGANDGLWDWPDISQDEEWWSERWYGLLGYRNGEIEASLSKFEAFLHPEDSSRVADEIRLHLEDRVPFDTEYRLRTKSGEYRWFRGRGQALWGEDGRPTRMSGSIQDITGRKQSEVELREKEARYRTLVESAPFCIHELNLDGKLTSMNSAGLSMMGVNDEAAICGMDYRSIPTPSDRVRIGRLLDEAIEGQASEFDFYSDSEDGQLHFTSCFIPIKDEHGQVEKLMGLTQNITQRDSLEQQLRQAQKMEAIGHLTGGIAHDFNNILGIVLGNLDLLKLQTKLDSKAVKRIETIRKSAQRAATLTKSLLNFSHAQALDTVTIDINALITDMGNLIARSLTPEVELERKFADNLWTTDIHTGDFEDSLINLALNARDAMPGAGRLTLETSNYTLDEDFCERNPGATPGEHVKLTISDTGVGMSLEQQQHIFEPFFTTKDPDKGTGLGLAMVYGFVKRCHGYIRVNSEPGAGSSFDIYLPRSEEGKPLRLSPDESPNAVPGGAEVVLVVDDEAELLELAKLLLQGLGYRVLTAAHGDQALIRLAEEPSIELLFSDVVMPGAMNGYALAEAATADRPDLRVLLTSGYTEKVPPSERQQRFAANLLNKPYSRVELAQRVRDVLDSG